MLRLVIETWNDTDLEWDEVLTVLSDGEARYQVSGRHLREKVKGYETEDDLHVMGLVALHLGSLNSREYLQRQLTEHAKG